MVAIVALMALLLPALFGALNESKSEVVILGTVTAESNEDNAFRELPLTATDIIVHGNEWWEFTLNGKRWLFCSDGYDRSVLALIPQE